MANQLKWLIFILISIGLLSYTKPLQAQTYYWVGGQGDWTDLSHWAASSGGNGGAFVQVPQSYNDIVIDENSGFSQLSENNRFISFNTGGANITSKNVLVRPGVTGFYFKSNVRWDIYGAIDIAQMRPIQNNWGGRLYLFASDSIVHEFGQVQLHVNSIYVEPTGGVHVFNNLKTNFTNLNLNPSANGKVYFKGTLNTYNITISSGNIYFETPIYGVNNNSKIFKFTITDGKAFFESNSYISGVYLQNTGQLYANGNKHEWEFFYANRNTNALLDISNAEVEISDSWSWTYTLPQLIANNSTIIFTGLESNFIGGNQAYYKVIFRHKANLKGSNLANVSNAQFYDLIFEKGFWTYNPVIYTISHQLELKNNGLYNQEGNYANPIPHLVNFKLLQGANTILQGDCIHPLSLRKINFDFGNNTNQNIIGDYVILDEVNALGNALPYQIGTHSFPVHNSENRGWIFNNNLGKNYIWVGPIPNNINDINSYGDWHNPQNWADADIYPNAQSGDTHLAANCIPNIYDNVVFKENAYVAIKEAYAGVKNISWEGSGNFANTNAYKYLESLFEIYGNLTWSNNMRLSYNGIIKFRATGANTIQSNQQTFPFKVIFEATKNEYGYTLLDEYKGNISIENEYLLDFRRGLLISNGFKITVPNFVTESNNIRILNISNSDLYITGGYFGRQPLEWNSVSNQFNIIDDNATIHISKLGDANGNNSKILIGRGHDINHIIFYGDRPQLTHPNTATGIAIYRHLEFKNSGAIESNANQIDSIFLLQTHTSNEYIIHAFELRENHASATMIIDSALFAGNTNFKRDIIYTSLLSLNRGHIYTLNNNNAHTQKLKDNAILKANGTCIQSIQIKHGFFNSDQPQNAAYLTIENNTVTSNNFTYTNSTIVGNTSGWSGTNSTARTLYWFNAQSGAHVGNWQDNSNWSLANGYMLDANGGNDISIGNCPPTSFDIVYFTDQSFDTGDKVLVAASPQSIDVKDMYWTNTKTVTFASANNTEILNIHGNLTLSNAMINQFAASIYFLGENNENTITNNGISFASNIYFNGKGSTWYLADDLVALSPHIGFGLYLQSGTLNTNGHSMRLHSLYSNYTTERKLVIANSTIQIQSNVNSCWDLRGSNIALESTASTISFTSPSTHTLNFHVQLGNHLIYDKIEFISGQPQVSGIAVGVDNFIFNKGGWLNTKESYIHKGISTSADNNYLFEIHADNNIFDSLILKGNAVFKTSNTYTNLLELSPAKTYTFYAGKVQHLKNEADFIAIGTGGGGEIYFNSSNTNAQSYIRKDSGQICVDFIYMRDIWAIGNGLSTETNCNSSLCDTAAISSLMPSFATSGRAVFNAGGNANNQGNNAGWDFNPYPAAPQMKLHENLPNYFCTDEQYTAVFELIGKLPMNVYFDIEMNGSIQHITIQDIQPISGNGTIENPYIWHYYFMPDQNNTTKIIAKRVENLQCFNPDGIGQGMAEINVFPCILPIDLIAFDVNCQNDKAIAIWEITQSNTESFFELETSVDGINFMTVNRINAQENQLHYTQTIYDNKGKYYRLKITDENQNVAYSAIISIACSFDNRAENPTILFPNPVTDIINIQYANDKNQSINFDIINVQGQVVYSSIFQAQTGYNIYTFENINLINGVYFLRLTNAEKSHENIKFIVRK